MGLLQTKLQSSIDEYISAVRAIEYLAIMTKDEPELVSKYLLNNQVEYLLDTYVINDLFQITETGCDLNGLYGATFSILNTIAKLERFLMDDSDDRFYLESYSSPELKEFDNLYWKKADLFSLPAIVEAGLTLEGLEKVESEYREYKLNGHLNRVVELFSKDIGVDAPIHIVKMFNQDYYTIEEASLFIHSNRNEDDKYHFNIEPNPMSMSFIGDFIKRGQLAIEKDGKISRENLKTFLASTDYIIKGFNDHSNSLESLKLTIQINKLIKENEELKKEIDNLKDEKSNSSNDHSRFGMSAAAFASPESYQKHRDELLVKVGELEAEILEKDKKIKELESNNLSNDSNLLSLIFDESTTNRYAPDLVYAIKAWEAIYIKNPKLNSHNNKANTWISKNTPYSCEQEDTSTRRLREIISPYNEWKDTRKKLLGDD